MIVGLSQFPLQRGQGDWAAFFLCILFDKKKSFVYLPLIVRRGIRAVEGNLCLYLNVQSLENFGRRYKIRVDQPISQSIVYIDAYRLGKQYLFLLPRVFQSLYI